MIPLIIAATLFCGALGVPIDESRIVGGDDAKLGEFPFIVSVKRNGAHVCGGSILNEQSILTAAHCVSKWDPSTIDYSIQYGIISLKEKFNIVTVTNVTIHENYTVVGGYPNDIAIMKLAAPILYSKFVNAVELPAEDELPTGQAVLAGWGAAEGWSGNMINLQRVDLDVMDDDTCAASEWGYNPLYHICAGKKEGGKSQCSGDSGGPLTAHGKQFGIVSWSHKPCASPGRPGVLTKVVNYLQWIKDHI